MGEIAFSIIAPGMAVSLDNTTVEESLKARESGLWA